MNFTNMHISMLDSQHDRPLNYTLQYSYQFHICKPDKFSLIPFQPWEVHVIFMYTNSMDAICVIHTWEKDHLDTNKSFVYLRTMNLVI